MFERNRLDKALEMLGALLDERHAPISVLVIGGSSLLLLGIIERPTADVDVVGFSTATGYRKADRLPQSLDDAVRDVGEALGLGPRWFNTGPAGLVDFGLPPGLESRVTIKRHGALELHLPAAEDLVCFKLYALVDQTERSKHFADLHALAPTRDQLLRAARWTRTHDPSIGFLGELIRILSLFDVEVDSDDLVL
jgi:hypothetical protein